MATYIKGLADKDGNIVNPRTSIEAVEGLSDALSEKQESLTAGDGIAIDNNVISATRSGTVTDVKLDGTSVTSNGVANINIGASTLVHTSESTPSTPVSLVNADTLDGHDSSYFATAESDSQKVSYTESQTMTSQQKAIARQNLGVNTTETIVAAGVNSVNSLTGDAILDGTNIKYQYSDASSLTIKGEIDGLKSQVSEDYNVVGTDFPIALGTWENGNFVSWRERITNRYAIKVTEGTIITVLSPTLRWNIGIIAIDTPTTDSQNTGWIAPSNSVTTVTSNYNGFLHIVFSKTASSPMDISDYDATVKIYNTIPSIISVTNEKINDALTVTCDYDTYSGGYIRADNGNVSSNSSTGYTGYIDVSNFFKIISPIDHIATYQMAFYDENKIYVSGNTLSPSSAIKWVLTVPDNAIYARLSFYLDVENTFYVKGIIDNIDNYIHNTKLNGKKLGIVGDSISTYQGYIPSGYATFYPRNTVQNVNQTWWKQLIDETGMQLCVNASWSGSTISGDTTITSGYVGCSDARVNALTDGSGNKPDIIIVWIGINDFGKTNGITCGTYDGTTGVITDTNIASITDAFGVLLKKLQTTYPDARIFVCRILPEQFASEMADSFANGFPNINPNDNVSLPELNDKIEKIANAFGCGVIPMDKCGATFFNINSYTGDGLHPNALLTPKMCEIAKEVLLNIM